MAYHVLKGETAGGPLDLAAIAAMVARGEVRRETLVWTAGMDDWAAAATVPEIAALFDADRVAGPLDMTRAVGDGLGAFRRAPWPAISVAFLYNFLPVLLFVPFLAAIVANVEGDLRDAMASREGLVVASALGLAMTAFVSILYGGLCVFMTTLLRGGPVHTALLFAGFRRAGALAGFGVLYSVVVVAGLMALVVPGIVAAVAFALTPFIIMESGLGAAAAMAASWRAVMTLGWWRLFAVLAGLFLAFILCAVLAEAAITAMYAVFGRALAAVLEIALQFALNIAVTIIVAATLASVYEQARRNRQRS